MIRRISTPFIGPDATDTELALAWGTAVLAAVAQAATAVTLGWSAVQLAVAVAFAADVGGGVVVNATRAGSRYWNRPERGSRALFYAAHIHPLVIGAMWPEVSLSSALSVYAGVMLCATTLAATPLPLKRPMAALLTGVGLVVAPLATFPAGLDWIPGLLLLKLIAGHGVPETDRSLA